MSDPQSRNEALIEAIINETTYTDPPQSRNEAILKSILDETEYTKAPQSRMEDLLIQLKEYIEEGGDGKIRLDDVDNADITLTGTTASITWKDPEDIIIQEVVLAEWAGTKVVRKAGSVPTSVDDGVLIVDSTTRDEYESAGFEDEGLEYEVTYYYRFFPYTTKGLVTNGTVKEVTAWATHIYGAEWDGTSTTAWTRTDESALFTDPVPAVNNGNGSSPFDSLQPWAGMTVSERTGGTMVSIPKFWYKLSQTGNKIKVQIADGALDGYSVSPAHMDRGDGSGERDTVYIGRYHCASDYKSKTGVKPVASITRTTARSSIHNLNSKIWQCDFAMRFTLWLLYIVEFADWNSQAKIGYGCGNNSATENMGSTDGMTYHTGTNVSNRTTYGHVQYRHIEGLWDNVYDWCDGCYYNSSGLNIILKPASFSDSTGGILMGKPSSGYPSKFIISSDAGFPAFYPTEASGSNSSYSCDSWYCVSSNPCLCVGGGYSQNQDCGLFCVYCASSSNTDGHFGCRLQELP